MGLTHASWWRSNKKMAEKIATISTMMEKLFPAKYVLRFVDLSMS